MTDKTITLQAGTPWFKSWFNTSFYHSLYSNRNDKEAAEFINNLISELNPVEAAAMLDLGCGNGRHSKFLASKGFDVTGLDLASSSIRMARKNDAANLRFICQDMRSPFGENRYDYVLSFFTSFGYFNDAEDDNKVVRNISESLKPGGTLVMDYINAVYSESRLTAKEEKEIDGVVYVINRWTDETHFYKKITLLEPLFGYPLEFTEQVRKFSVKDFESMYSNNGLQLEKVFGDYQLNEFDSSISPRIILIAKKL